MEQALASRPGRAKAVSLSKVIEARSRGSSRRNTAIMTATVSAADLPASRAASTSRVLRSLGTSTGLARQQLPELLALLPGPVDEGVDRLERHRTEPALLAALEPAGDLLGGPAFRQALPDEAAEPRVALEDGRALATLQVAALGL